MADIDTLPVRPAKAGKLPGVSPNVLLLRDELRSDAMEQVATLALGDLDIEISAGRDSLWAIVRRKGRGGLALRAAHAPGGCGKVRTRKPEEGEALRLEFDCAIGRQSVAFRLHEDEVPILRVTTRLTPAVPLLVPFLPRDLYPLDVHDDPTRAVGQVEAAQRGLNAGYSYFRLTEPGFGSTLYFQNFTTLNPYFEATRTTPDGAVGGEWPEIGYLPPTAPQKGKPPLDPLPEGQETAISDTYLAFHADPRGDETAMARRFLSLLGAVYRRLEHPETDYHDWIDRAERALKDLDQAPAATIRHYGFRYVHPYTAAEYPDSMVQLSVLASIRDYEAWKKEEIPLFAEFAAGLRKFYDPRLKTMRRYLPNVGADKDKDAVDSWYLYHPMLNLGRLALDGNKKAKRLFLQSIDYGIESAHHFDYKWPIQYNVTDRSVITAARDDEGLGQTDVGGIYAYVMLQAFELTDDKRFLDEARASIDATRGMRFELNYQANLTAWGAAACLRLWRITNEKAYLDQAYVFLASFFHNNAMWESEIGYAKYYRNFLGVTALHDAPYMAMYECFDSFAAFERFLKDSGPDVDPAVRLLLSEYCRYALDRAWYYYPDALPEDAIETDNVRNSYVDRALSFPVEDLYVDGQKAGQVGQEIYGAGAAFVFASRAFHSVSDAPFRLFCDHFLLASDRPGEKSLSFQLGGAEGCEARLCLLRSGRATLPAFTVTTMAGDRVRGHEVEDRIEFRVPADGRITVAW
ncbi:hypothetical protein [Sphingomonas psychrotolerans]|uniref:Uncharacterized protein n=1 Tax=Sphingomonas psychrotolerans TaxID=1327635 RepID=A0A2K8MEF5_9SPHN|nr:hypothetical protein [Sphingomonas psychrotolerans]ATY32280.1 hypothetical protein CVN68_10070 [Sphingomonas psychrotolerans]